tara:strand:- start:27481 stop:28395 length:915 start_codon:yes stop_codon:yes gene_type:complete
MGMKSAWIKLSGGVDKLASGFAYNPAGNLILSGLFGAVFGSILSFGTAILKNEGVQDFSEGADQEMQVFENGTLMRFPEDCGLDDDYYLLSKKPGGGMEISKGNYDFSHVLNASAQQKVTNNISACMDVMAKWARNDNFEFSNEFRHITGVEYSEAGLIHDLTEEETWLYKDILNMGDSETMTMETMVKNNEGYVEDDDNKALYRAAFKQATNSWGEYRRNDNQTEPYYASGEIKNADQYAQYEYHSMSFATWGKTVGGVGLLALFMIAGGDTRRSSAYETRAAKRRERLSAINALSGRDTPIL